MRDKVFAFVDMLRANGIVEISSVMLEDMMHSGDLHVLAPIDKRWNRRKLGQYLKAAENYGLIEFLEYRYNKVVGNTYKIKVYEVKGEQMMLKAKIKREYMDQIVNGEKTTEYRQIEGLLLSDGNRTLKVRVRNIHMLNIAEQMRIMQRYPDVKWSKHQGIFAFDIEPEALWIGSRKAQVFDDESKD